MKLVRLDNLFRIDYGSDLELNALNKSRQGINFVSRTEKNNGVSAKVELVSGIDPNPAGTISVPLGGSVLSAYLQEKPYYSGRDLVYLTPRAYMDRTTLLYYCLCIKSNKYKYNFGRQANKSLGTIKLPSIESIPKFVNSMVVKDISHYSEMLDRESIYNLKPEQWQIFKLYPNLFDMEAGKYYSASSFGYGKIPLISSSTKNNGETKLTNLSAGYEGNCITIGKVACSAFYQKSPFCATADCTVLIPKFNMNHFVGVFISTVLNQESFRWNYGRQIRLNNCRELEIKLPALIGNDNLPVLDQDGNMILDLDYMKSYIKTLPFTKEL